MGRCQNRALKVTSCHVGSIERIEADVVSLDDRDFPVLFAFIGVTGAVFCHSFEYQLQFSSLPFESVADEPFSS